MDVKRLNSDFTAPNPLREIAPVLLPIDGGICPHGPILQKGHEAAASVNNERLAVGDLRGFDVGEDFLIVVTEDGGFAVLRLDAAHTAVKIDDDRVRCR